MKKALNACTVDKYTDFEQMFAAASAAGFDGIELNIDKVCATAHSLSTDFADIEYRILQRMSKKYSLPIVSISSSLTAGMAGDRTRHDGMRFLLAKQLEAAKALGAGGVLTVPGGMNGREASREASIDFFKSVRADIEAAGITVGLEDPQNGFFPSPHDMASMIDEIGSPYIGACCVVGDIIAASESEEYIKALGERIKFVRIKGGGQNGGTESYTADTAEWKRIITALRKTGFDGYLTSDIFNRDADMTYADHCKKAASYIDAIIKL